MTTVNTALRCVRHSRFLRSLPVKAAEVIYKNDLVIWDNGNTRAIQGVATGSALKCAGIAMQDVTGGAADGDVTIDVEQGDFELTNSGTNVIVAANVFNGATAYIEANDTIGNVAGTATAAGPLVGLNGTRPIVRIEY